MAMRVAQRKTVGAGGGVEQRIRPAAANNEAIGEGLIKLGQLGGEIAIRQDKLDEQFDDTMSRKVALDYQKRAAAVRSEYEATSGINAVNGRSGTEEALKKIYDENLEQANNPRMRAMLAERMDQMYSSDTIRVGAHAVKELKVETSNTLKVQASQSGEMAAENWDDPVLSRKYLDTGLTAIDRLGEHEGWSDEVIAFERDKFQSNAHAQVVDNMMRVEDYEAAEVYLDAHSGEILYGDEKKLRDDMQPGLQRREARDDFMRATGIMPVSEGGGEAFSYQLPVAGSQTSKYGAKRGDSSHNGLDIAAPVGTAIRPMAPGQVKKVSHDARSGNYIIIQHADGTTTSYSHMQGKSPLKEGDPVGASTMIGRIGMTGNTTGPHVHIVAKRGDQTLDPNSLVGSNAGNSPREWDKATVYENIETLAAKEGWSVEKMERAKAYADREISRDEQLLARQERAADKEYSEFILNNPEITNVAQVPRSLRDRMSVTARLSLQKTVEANNKPKPVDANGDTALALKIMRIMDPEQFAQTDLSKYVGEVTRGEISSLVVDQAKLNSPEGKKEVSLRSGISSAINFHATPDMGLDSKKDREDFMKVHAIMETELKEITGGKRSPTDREYAQAFASATTVVKQHYKRVVPVLGFEIGSTDKEKPRYALEIDDVPPKARTRIIESWQAAGNKGAPSDEVIAAQYRKYKGRLW